MADFEQRRTPSCDTVNVSREDGWRESCHSALISQAVGAGGGDACDARAQAALAPASAIVVCAAGTARALAQGLF